MAANVKGFFRHPARRTHRARVAHSAAGWRKGLPSPSLRHASPVELNRCSATFSPTDYGDSMVLGDS
jgi:hypothetical protein